MGWDAIEWCMGRWVGLGWLLATELEYVGCKINCVVSKSQQRVEELITMPKREKERERERGIGRQRRGGYSSYNARNTAIVMRSFLLPFFFWQWKRT